MELKEYDQKLFDDLRLDLLESEILDALEETTNDGLCDADDIPEPPKEAITQPGDLWILGEHRLLCGDSTKAEDVIRLMNGKRAALFATDPRIWSATTARTTLQRGVPGYEEQELGRNIRLHMGRER
jgi:hypothetical protein